MAAATRQVVIAGAGQAGATAAAELRARGFTGSVTLVGAEEPLPYQRPPLSKGYLAGGTGTADLLLRPASFYADQDIELVLGDAAAAIDRDGQCLTLASGRQLRYDRLVLATGARPRPLPVPGAGLDGVLGLNTLTDAATLREGLADGLPLVVVGGGFIGLEAAATARALGQQVTVVEAGPRVMARAVSPTLSDHLTALHRGQGTRIMLGRDVVALHGDAAGRVRSVELDDRTLLPAGPVLVGIGVLPRTGLATAAGLAVGDGILVDRQLRTSDPAIHAIGDCARFPSPFARRQVRLESVQNATDQARCLAAVLCGEPEQYRAVPWFWTEQHGARVQIAGLTQGSDRRVMTGHPSTGRFSVFCFRGEQLLGAESVNRTADHMITRRLLAGGDPGLSPETVAAPGFDLKSFQRQPV
ncbi:FAD-dependent oxidoreductase [Streptomyces sp. ACA25]|uniref:NAD(P)/FAD-dependent oxidoreductase n=1 Tax=Streptomyces sp. ACA25 TaxID=3022596 RepID=UPI002306FF82|nr:FAD-dependent oxidoreductase [Streptomyces sp. ACA25]MDB1089550.1 FAD-dependent oxidoreductase [Streptomyces sp. ACA25]